MARKKKQAPAEAPAAAPDKPRSIQIKSVKRGRKSIEIGWEQGDASFDLCERDNPLPSFGAALDALAPIVATVCHFLPDYAATGLRVVGLKLGEQSGAGTVSFKVRKNIDDAAKEFAFDTPERLLAHPTMPGKYTPPLTEADAALVAEAVEQARMYIIGERAQGQIELPEDGDDEDSEDDKDDGDKLPL
jgi:hypothetical protein